MNSKSNPWLYCHLLFVLTVILCTGVAVCIPDRFRVELAAKFGNRSSQHELGWMYATGTGVTRNRTEAIEWLTKAAAKGDLSSQFYLGFMYMEGDGADGNKALKWFTLAAEQGYVSAQYFLGLMYADGEGIQKDAAEGYMWLDLAADSLPFARARRDALRIEMSEDSVAQARRRSSNFKLKTWDQAQP